MLSGEIVLLKAESWFGHAESLCPRGPRCLPGHRAWLEEASAGAGSQLACMYSATVILQERNSLDPNPLGDTGRTGIEPGVLTRALILVG